MLHLYTDVPICPKCQNNRTGYFIYGQYQDGNLLYKHLKKGEYIYFKGILDNAPTCFCLNCGIEWKGKTKLKIITGTELKKIKEEKGITKQYIHEIRNNLENIKKESDNIILKKPKKLQKIKNFICKWFSI